MLAPWVMGPALNGAVGPQGPQGEDGDPGTDGSDGQPAVLARQFIVIDDGGPYEDGFSVADGWTTIFLLTPLSVPVGTVTIVVDFRAIFTALDGTAELRALINDGSGDIELFPSRFADGNLVLQSAATAEFSLKTQTTFTLMTPVVFSVKAQARAITPGLGFASVGTGTNCEAIAYPG